MLLSRILELQIFTIEQGFFSVPTFEGILLRILLLPNGNTMFSKESDNCIRNRCNQTICLLYFMMYTHFKENA
jgi:hypothetical protein